MRNKYLFKLIFYLKETRDLLKADLLQLRDIKNYLDSRLNKDSATDTTNLLKLEKLIDKIEYASKYYDVCIDFYEDK